MSVFIAASNPFRPVDWRWQRAIRIADGGLPRTTKRIDTPVGFAWIRKALRFLRQQALARTEAATAELVAAFPEIYWARWLWQHPGPQRHSVEAHILARSSDFEIGYRCGIPPGTIETYEALFFNVREKLLHPQYIFHTVFGEGPRSAADAHYLLWKRYAYALGPHVLTAMESGFTGASWCGTPDTVGAVIQDDAIGTLKLKAAMAAKTISVNPTTQLALLEQFTKFVEVERNTDSAGKAQDQLLSHINAMMEAIPLNVAGFDPKTGRKLPATALSEYDGGAVELTFEETMRVAARRPIANAEMLKALTFQDASSPNVLPSVPVS